MAVLCAHSGELWAAKEYRVVINSEPSGASVWIDDRAGDSVGTTPYEGTLPEGKHTVFLELNGYEFAVQEINVRRRRRGKQRFSFELAELRYGSIDVLAASGSEDADGAKVFIDGKEVGTVPDTFDAPEGAHQVEVVQDGFNRFESWVEVEKGESVEVNVALKSTTDENPNANSSTSKPDTGGSVSRPKADSGPSPAILAAGMGAGWRRFDYNQPRTNNLRPYSADGVAFVNLGAEFHFGALTSSLDMLSIFGGASLSLPLNSTTADGAVEIATSWIRREAGVRVQFDVGPGALGLDVAEGGNAFTFEGAGLLIDEIPQATYEYVRAGGSYGVRAGDNYAGAGADGLFVLASTGVSERFDDASIMGVRVHGFYRRHLFSGVEAALTGSFTQFSYTLTGNAQYDADSSYDRMFDLILSGGYNF